MKIFRNFNAAVIMVIFASVILIAGSQWKVTRYDSFAAGAVMFIFGAVIRIIEVMNPSARAKNRRTDGRRRYGLFVSNLLLCGGSVNFIGYAAKSEPVPLICMLAAFALVSAGMIYANLSGYADK